MLWWRCGLTRPSLGMLGSLPVVCVTTRRSALALCSPRHRRLFAFRPRRHPGPDSPSQSSVFLSTFPLRPFISGNRRSHRYTSYLGQPHEIQGSRLRSVHPRQGGRSSWSLERFRPHLRRLLSPGNVQVRSLRALQGSLHEPRR